MSMKRRQYLSTFSVNTVKNVKGNRIIAGVVFLCCILCLGLPALAQNHAPYFIHNDTLIHGCVNDTVQY